MKMRLCNLVVCASTAAVLFCLAPAPAAAQSAAAAKVQPSAIPRLPDGKPDFNGVWDHPRVADVTKSNTGCAAFTPGCKQEGTGELPFTEWGLAQWKSKEERVDYSAHCLPWGYTRAWQVEYPVEIVQTPKRLALLFESNNIFHVIHLDTTGHPKDLDPSWMGHSVGQWDGDTLVIDTVGFNGKTWIDTAEHPSSDALHVIEHMHYIDPQHIAYDVTWEDAKAYTKPIKNTRVLSRMKAGADLMEFWCMENNKDLLERHLTR
jgi:hypothetical protein